MTTLVIGGTGNVGGAVVRELLARGLPVRVLTRSAEKSAALPEGATAAIGDMASPASLGPAFAGAERAFLMTPLDQNETELGLAAVAAATAARVGRLVYMSVHRVDSAPHIPIFANKIPVERAIRGSKIPYTIVRPNQFMQMDLLVLDAMRKGVYPTPIGDVGLSPVDVRDIAAVVVKALTEDGHAGMTYALVGPDVLTGRGTAEVWSRHLGRQVRYAGNDLDAWEGMVRAMLPGWLIHDLRIMYEHFQRHGLAAGPDELAAMRRVLGREPRRLDGLAREVSANARAGTQANG
ncbi:MAG TPA: NmrA family NAD(P)-binding protein [Gemmatimonadales bacterium]|nr:NmrA family NAD(P)-binding protein [Gemmatimonadales bacterium]